MAIQQVALIRGANGHVPNTVYRCLPAHGNSLPRNSVPTVINLQT